MSKRIDKNLENHMVLPEAHGRPEREEPEYEGQPERTMGEKLEHLEKQCLAYEQMFLGEQRRADRLEAELKQAKKLFMEICGDIDKLSAGLEGLR